MRYTLIALLLAGCAAPMEVPDGHWTHQNASAAQFERDRNACVYEAEKATAAYSPGYAPPTMQGLVIQRAHEANVNERKLAVLDACMRARGYWWQVR